jgi:hypothetical protein
MMSDLYDRIVSERGSVERLMATIPGFGGYMERASRRTADRMLRDFLADQVTQCVNRFAALEKRLLDAGGLMLMSKTRSTKTKIQTYHDRVKAAMPGYSGFFAAIKIDEDALEQLYSFDEAQIRFVDKLKTALDGLDEAIKTSGDVDAALTQIDTVAVEANEAFKLRDDVLTNLNATL